MSTILSCYLQQSSALEKAIMHYIAFSITKISLLFSGCLARCIVLGLTRRITWVSENLQSFLKFRCNKERNCMGWDVFRTAYHMKCLKKKTECNAYLCKCLLCSEMSPLHHLTYSGIFQQSRIQPMPHPPKVANQTNAWFNLPK